MPLTRQQILSDLQRLPLQKGDLLLVHSSLSSLGQVDGGPEAVIDALLESIGPDGTLLMPSFQAGGQHDLLRRGCTFDIRTAPSQMGLISETFRRRPKVLRSLSPTHCTAALGNRAAELLADHQHCNVSVGRNSPYDKLVHAGGKILLLGVEHSSNTTLHLIENIHGAPTVCRELFQPIVIDADGKSWTVPTHPHMPGLKRRYPRVETELLAAGIQKNSKIGPATARLINALPMATLLADHIRQNPVYLCDVFTP